MLYNYLWGILHLHFGQQVFEISSHVHPISKEITRMLKFYEAS